MIRHQGNRQGRTQGARPDSVDQLVRDVAREVGVDENGTAVQGDPVEIAGRVKDAIRKRM